LEWRILSWPFGVAFVGLGTKITNPSYIAPGVIQRAPSHPPLCNYTPPLALLVEDRFRPAPYIIPGLARSPQPHSRSADGASRRHDHINHGYHWARAFRRTVGGMIKARNVMAIIGPERFGARPNSGFIRGLCPAFYASQRFIGDMSLSQKGPLKCALEVQYRYVTQN